MPARQWLWGAVLVMLLSTALLTCARAEPRPVTVGYLSASELEDQLFLPLLRETLAAHGWHEGRNLRLEGRHATQEPQSYSAAANALAVLRPNLIFASGAPALKAMYTTTRDIPIVTTDFSSDPIQQGYAASYGRPGGNVTGVFLDAPQIAGKWFEILQAMVPGLRRVAVLWNPDTGETHLRSAKQVARSLGIRLRIYEARTWTDAQRAFKTFERRHQALIILPSPVAYAFSTQLAALCLKHRLPATSMAKGFAAAGGLVSYGPNLRALNARAFDLAARILAGASPATLPIETPAQFDFLLNARTAARLGIRMPDRFLVGAELVDH